MHACDSAGVELVRGASPALVMTLDLPEIRRIDGEASGTASCCRGREVLDAGLKTWQIADEVLLVKR